MKYIENLGNWIKLKVKKNNMTATLVSYCLICDKRKTSYVVFIADCSFSICKKCWDWATKVHQLNIYNPKLKLKVSWEEQ
jgi:hypothetical protein